MRNEFSEARGKDPMSLFSIRKDKGIAERSIQPPAAPKGFIRTTEFDERDIFVAGYPKSGNTWFQDLIVGCVYGVRLEYCSSVLTQELVPDLHYKEYYQRYRTPMFFKTHHLPRPEFKRVVYLLRDGRDVMVSYLHHKQAMEGQTADFMKMVTSNELFPCPWHEHVNAWRRNPYGAEILTIKFEDLKRDATAELVRFCKFSGLERERGFLEEVAGAADFDKMQRREKEEAERLKTGWPKDKLFRRRGDMGSYQDEMPEEVQAAFLDRAGETLLECGYLDKNPAHPR
ncbi:MAG TPA: sulfotransferase domain-containing protein [Candidatus Saccharimonadales bacterium]|nr:sulfotransferase domain-containing protein [Candidatus Saccharimonadales bacterium]